MSHPCHLRLPIEFWGCYGVPGSRDHLSSRCIDDYIDAIVIWDCLDEARRPSKFQGTDPHRPEEVCVPVCRLQQLAGRGRACGGDGRVGGYWEKR